MVVRTSITNFDMSKKKKGKTRRKRSEKCYMLIMTTQNSNNQIHVASNIWNAKLKMNQTNIWTPFAFRSGLKIDFHLNKFQNFVGFFLLCHIDAHIICRKCGTNMVPIWKTRTQPISSFIELNSRSCRGKNKKKTFTATRTDLEKAIFYAFHKFNRAQYVWRMNPFYLFHSFYPI